MSRTHTALCVLSLLLVCSACGTLKESADRSTDVVKIIGNVNLYERDFKIDPTLVFQETTLGRLIANPTAFLTMDVEFRAMMKDHAETLWEPYYTSMPEEHFYNFSVWPEGGKLWTAEGWGAALDTLYVNKDGPSFTDFLELKKFEIVVIRGRVMSDFRGRPWINCFYVDRISEPVYTNASVEKLVLGTTEREDRFNAAAIHSLKQALEGTLPDEALFSAHFQLGDLYFQRGTISRRVEDFQKAIDHYGEAVSLNSSHEGAATGLNQANASLERQIQINRQKAEDAKKRTLEQLERERKRRRKKEDIEDSYRRELRKKPR